MFRIGQRKIRDQKERFHPLMEKLKKNQYLKEHGNNILIKRIDENKTAKGILEVIKDKDKRRKSFGFDEKFIRLKVGNKG